MEVFHTKAEVRDFVRKARREERTIGCVPTMGALHAGHAALIVQAKAECAVTVVSIFVNPAQFDRPDDLERYPRTLDDDLAICRKQGVDAVFVPDAAEMYGGGSLIMLAIAHLADTLCGMSRPGHFRGVLLVVAKLFNVIQPDKAYFGEKDIQQLVIIKRMVKDLDFPVEIRPVAIVREKDGVALSSRNVHLSASERKSARKLSQALLAVSDRVRELEGLEDVEEIVMADVLADAAEMLVADPKIELDYFAAVDHEMLDDVAVIRKGTIFAVAAWVGETRLIDNWIYR